MSITPPLTVFATFFKREYAFPVSATALTLLILLGVFFKGFISPTANNASRNDIKPDVVTTATTPVIDLNQISSWHIFGLSESNATTDGTIADATSLAVKLRGVFYLGRNNQARAIIESADQTQKTYQINAQLPGGEILKAIDQDKVILLINNQETTLPLSKPEPLSEALEATPAQ